VPAVAVRRALISVFDKSGVVELAQGLAEAGVTIVSSGGTARAIADSGIAVTPVSEVTGAPEILGGRVKTLHPMIHGGILANRSVPEHMQELAAGSITPIDLVVCNLYPFERAVAHPSVTEAEAIEQIDIGGPAMVRAAAKNFYSVAVVVSPDSYAAVLAEIRASGGVSDELRATLAAEAFRHTAAYDAAIGAYLGRAEDMPDRLVWDADKIFDLRYGENPHQSAAFYKSGRLASGLAGAEQLGGKELSYNNLLDLDAAWGLTSELEGPGAAIIKHSNPCGAAVADRLHLAYERALECDPTSAFGGIVALNRACDAATAEAITKIFTEVVAAPDFDADALEALTTKKSLRVLRMPGFTQAEREVRSVAGALLVQSPDPSDDGREAKVVTTAEPTREQWDDLRFAWVVAKHTKSNAIVFASHGVAVGVGAGQMNRLEAAELAARRSGDRSKGAVCASDAFFPFRDGLDAVVASGVAAVVQPGGSVRDDEVIAAADEHGIAMVFTGRRHFRH